MKHFYSKQNQFLATEYFEKTCKVLGCDHTDPIDQARINIIQKALDTNKLGLLPGLFYVITVDLSMVYFKISN